MQIIKDTLLSKNITSDSLYYIVLGLKHCCECSACEFYRRMRSSWGCGPNFSGVLRETHQGCAPHKAAMRSTTHG